MATSKKLNGETLFDLTSYVADTPASLSQQQANATAQTTHDTFGLGSEKPLASYDQSTQSWKMYEDTFLLDSMLYLGKWPASGMTLSGRLFPQPQLVRRIVEIASSLWPTPTVDDSKNVNPKPNRRPGLVSAVNESLQNNDGSTRLWPTPTASVDTSNINGKFNNLTLWDAVRMWPTPTTQEVEHPEAQLTETGRRISKDGTSSHSLGLADAVRLWPTPTAVTRPMEGNVRAYRAKIQAGEMTEAEAEAILGKSVWEAQGKIPAIWPTPTHGKLAGGSGAFQQIQDKYDNNEITLEEKKAMQAGNGGRLNPMWVEWLMGFPLGWTDLEDSETL
jgi:DNA (cytosine-5)-methyltransferase 1